MGCFYMEKCNSNANMFDSQQINSHSPLAAHEAVEGEGTGPGFRGVI